MSKSLTDILEGLPDIDFTGGITSESIESDMIDDYNTYMSDHLGMDYDLPAGDPMRCLIEACVDIFSQIVYLIDNDGKMNFLKYAYGEYLDHLGLLKGVYRKDAQPASVTMQFSASEQPEIDIVIPEGTEVAADDDTYFATDTDCTIPAAVRSATTLTLTLTAQSNDFTIPAETKVMDDDESIIFHTTDPVTIASGATTATVNAVADDPGELENGHPDGTFTKFGINIPGLTKISNTETSGGIDTSLAVSVTATCEDDGEIGNGYTPGDIAELIDEIAGVDACTNLDTSAGGSNTEDDDELRERIYNAPALYSTTGPILAYKYKAEDYSDDIQDVQVVSPSDGKVDVYVLLTGGMLPGEAVLKEIGNYLSADTVRPLTDQVTVNAPTVVNYDITATYHIRKSDAKAEDTIKNDVSDALEAYQTWQSAQIGRQIDPTELVGLMREAGAVQVVVTSPAITAIKSTEIAIANEVNVTYGGLIDD